MNQPQHHAAIAYKQDGTIVLAVAPLDTKRRPQVDRVTALHVTDGEAGVAEVYRLMRALGFAVGDSGAIADDDDVKERAVTLAIAAAIDEEPDEDPDE